jgi:hypothetical protein
VIIPLRGTEGPGVARERGPFFMEGPMSFIARKAAFVAGFVWGLIHG